MRRGVPDGSTTTSSVGVAARLHHSDRGAEYTSTGYQAALRARRVRCSMSGRGQCCDNAVVESLLRTLKSDLHPCVWATRAEAAAQVATYIDRFQNTRRLHSTPWNAAQSN